MIYGVALLRCSIISSTPLSVSYQLSLKGAIEGQQCVPFAMFLPWQPEYQVAPLSPPSLFEFSP